MAAARFLALTGWRRGEMLQLKWNEVDPVTRTARLAVTLVSFVHTLRGPGRPLIAKM